MDPRLEVEPLRELGWDFFFSGKVFAEKINISLGNKVTQTCSRAIIATCMHRFLKRANRISSPPLPVSKL